MRDRRPLSARSRLLASVALLALLLAAVSAVVQSAFTSTLAHPPSTFAAGTIALSGSVDRGSALFTLRGMKPGPEHSRCIKVTYDSTGGLESTVRLYGTSSGALADMMFAKITRGRFDGPAPADGSCAGFVADGDPIFHQFLVNMPGSYGEGIRDPDPSWTDGDSAVYRIDIELGDRDEAQGGTATHELVVEARTT